jgi:hypothetical protein
MRHHLTFAWAVALAPARRCQHRHTLQPRTGAVRHVSRDHSLLLAHPHGNLNPRGDYQVNLAVGRRRAAGQLTALDWDASDDDRRNVTRSVGQARVVLLQAFCRCCAMGWQRVQVHRCRQDGSPCAWANPATSIQVSPQLHQRGQLAAAARRPVRVSLFQPCKRPLSAAKATRTAHK